VLVDVCPGERDVETYLDWLATLSAGAAYDALHDWAGTAGPPLPRDFAAWRERMVQRLRAWNELYFGHVEPAVLDGLRSCAETLQARIGEPAQRLVEDATHGLWIEPSPNLRCVVLVPQYHQRPYNDHTNLDHAIEILYPAAVLPQPPDAVPLALLRLRRGLSDESRLRILRFLRSGPCTLTEVARFAGLSQPTVHHHLAQLRIAGLVRVHIYLSGPARYSLRPGAAEALARQVDSYLEPEKGAS
jgi:DNA-binding transcriptional ArsR family regulator